MGWTQRKCMVQECFNLRLDKTWFDDYWEIML